MENSSILGEENIIEISNYLIKNETGYDIEVVNTSFSELVFDY